MKSFSGEEIIRTFIDFFVDKGHQEIPSASLIPVNDPSILWINAGVTPLKKYFDGSELPSNRRLTSCQKCIRTGDIEEVGNTARHHTFFQMLGNFSIGDYFKEEALSWAFELLTSDKYFGLPIEKLYVTVYPDDVDAYNLWLKLGIPNDHIIKLEGNFWEIGEGPSGPDSEIFYDRGEEYDKDNLGIKLLENEIENDRYIEIWNNVFSQFNAKAGIDRKDYEELPSKNIDTGMGVERMACILQNTPTNYETDLFMPIINKLEEISKIKYSGQKEFKVIADHVRSLTFAISDGATFENYGRGYVLRRLLRRSVMMGKRLGINDNFMSSLVEVVVNKYSGIYPDILKNLSRIKELIKKEENLFYKTLSSGEKRLEEIFKNNSDNVISGKDAFKLYDTYGFPVELTEEYASENNFKVDMEGFKKYMNNQKEMARSGRKVVNSMNLQNEILINFKEKSTFIGYEKLGNKTEVIAIIKNDNFVDSIDDEGYIVLRENPFYAESGGQIYDLGYLKNDDVKLEVLDVVKAPNKQHLLHVKVLSGTLKVNSEVLTHVMQDRREEIAKNHSSTHLLQKSLQELLGDSVHQMGSRVDDKSFRFDFCYHGRLSDEVIARLEARVNEKVNEGNDTIIEEMSLEEAKKKGAMALFSDKYGDRVRVVTIGDSIELCAGTHVKNSKDIGRVAIISVINKGADTFRIEGATTENIKELLEEEVNPYDDEVIKLLSKAKNIISDANSNGIKLNFDYSLPNKELNSFRDVIMYKEFVNTLKEKIKKLEKDYEQEKTNKSMSDLSVYTNKLDTINGINTIITTSENQDVNTIKQIVSVLVDKYNNSFVLIANKNGNNVNIIAKTNNDEINCGDIVRDLSLKCNGNGGGSKTFAQGGGSDATNLDNYLNDIKDKLK